MATHNAHAKWEVGIQSAVLGMPGENPRPKGLKFYFDDTAKGGLKRVRPLGRYPEAARLCLEIGAGLADVLRPLHETEAYLRAVAAVKPGSLADALLNEMTEQSEADFAQMVLAENCHAPSDHDLEVFIKEGSEHREALDVLISTARHLRYSR